MTRTILRALIVCGLLIMPVGAQAQRGPVPVIVSEAKQEHIADRVEALGTLRANESVVLTATVTETVTAINFNDGQRVEQGDILVEMRMDEEQALLAEAMATAEEARRQVERMRPLVAQGATSQSMLDQRQREYDTAAARVNAIQSRLQQRVITAPFSGVVGLRNISLGAVLQPGTQITTLDDDSVMKLDFTVPSVFIQALHPGLAIVANARAFPGREFHGEIYSIDSRIDPVTRSVTVRALVPNDERMLRPGLLMSVELFKDPRDAVIIPEGAIVSEGQRNFVFVVRDGDERVTVERRTVRTGTRQVGTVEIIEGVTAGERVVTHGTMNISDGAAVTIRATQGEGMSIRDVISRDAAQADGQG